MAPSQAATNWVPDLKPVWSSSCPGPIKSIVVHQLKNKLAACTGSSVALHDIQQQSVSRKWNIEAQPAGIRAVAFNCKGTELVSGEADGWLKWRQVESGEETCTTKFPWPDGQSQQELPVHEVACSRSGLVAAASGRWVLVTVTHEHIS